MPLTLAHEAELTLAFETYRPKLMSLIQRRIDRRLTGRIDPEGVLQEAFLRARRKWPNFDRRNDIYCWLYGIVRDRLIEMIRAASGPTRDAGREVPWPQDSAARMLDILASSSTGPATAVVREEQRQRVRTALDLLVALDREILMMRYFDELAFKDIAAILEIKENTATVRCARALLKLRGLLTNS
jgi:RNA polymerase sigma-70 factor (ECF subfamily)